MKKCVHPSTHLHIHALTGLIKDEMNEIHVAQNKRNSMALRFIADSMLGKLARWLRLMGFDTLYFPSISDLELVRMARKEKRIILTMDACLALTLEKDKYIFLTYSNPYQQLKYLVKELGLDPWDGLFSRCVYCNKLVEKIKDKSEIKNKVPLHLFNSNSSFYRCPVCGRIYWEGSHHQKIRTIIKNLIRN